MAAAQSDADAEGHAPHPGRSQGTARPHRNPRRRRRAKIDGRPRQDDPRPPRVGACQTEEDRLLLSVATILSVIAGLDPAIHPSPQKEMDHRVSALRAGPVMTAE